ncbi:MAG: hypothetical protein R2715_15085 [Ilumatobacteraceae bacterium]
MTGPALEAIHERIRSGGAVTPAELVEAKAADELVVLQATEAARAAEEHDLERKEGALAAGLDLFAAEADEVADELLEAANQLEAAYDRMMAASQRWGALPQSTGVGSAAAALGRRWENEVRQAGIIYDRDVVHGAKDWRVVVPVTTSPRDGRSGSFGTWVANERAKRDR